MAGYPRICAANRCPTGTIAAEAIAAEMLFHGRFGIAITQMVIQAETPVYPRDIFAGSGMAFSIRANASAPPTSNTSPTSNRSCEVSMPERWSAASPAPANTRNSALRRKRDVCWAAAISGERACCKSDAPTTVTAVRIASVPMRREAPSATLSAILACVCVPGPVELRAPRRRTARPG